MRPPHCPIFEPCLSPSARDMLGPLVRPALPSIRPQIPSMSTTPNRREFLKTSAAFSAGVALTHLTPGGLAAATAPAPRRATTVGIATSVAPLARPGFERVLDDMQQRAGVNAVFPFIYTHVPNRAGVPAPATDFHGGNYAMPHMQYYRDTNLTFEDMRGLEFGDVDVFAQMIPAARQRGMKTFAWIIEDNRRGPGPRWEELYEIDFHGRRAPRHPGGPCNNHPQYRGYLMGLVEDYMRSYEIDGIMWGSERQGGLLNALGAYHNGARAEPGRATCFCPYCERKARDQGISVERARQGFTELEQFVLGGRAGTRPRDGYFVSFWRILLRYPELLAWENLWVRSRHELQRELYQKVKSIDPAMPVGWHMWHNLSFSPFHRAEEDFAEMAAFSDFIKPVLYNNAGGERIRSFTASTQQNVFGDLSPEQTLEFLYGTLNYDEAPIDSVAAVGLSPDYLRRETLRTLEAVAGRPVEVWPGFDIDAPVGRGSSQTTPESVKAAIHAVFDAGAQGVMLSRNYVEMKPENLSAAGDALRERGLI